MLRLAFILIILFYSGYLFYHSTYIDRISPTIDISKKINDKDKLFLTKQPIKTSLLEKKENGIKITISDESEIKFISMYFKNKQTNNKFLRFYINKKPNTEEKIIRLNNTLLHKVLFGNHLTTIKVITIDNSFNQNEHEHTFKITNKGKPPKVIIKKRSFNSFKNGFVDWVVFETKSKDKIELKTNEENIKIINIDKNKYGVLFFHQNNKNIYKFYFIDSYGNTTEKKISFLKLDNNKLKTNLCIKKLSNVNIKGFVNKKNKYINNFNKNSTFSNGIIIDKGICDNKKYFISIVEEDIYNIIHGDFKIPSKKEYNVNTKLEPNEDLSNFIIRNNMIFDIESYFIGIKNIYR